MSPTQDKVDTDILAIGQLDRFGTDPGTVDKQIVVE